MPRTQNRAVMIWIFTFTGTAGVSGSLWRIVAPRTLGLRHRSKSGKQQCTLNQQLTLK